MKHLRLFIALIGIFISITAQSGTISNPVKVKAGETATLRCTASAPAGYITHAFFSFTDPGDAEYLGIGYTSSDCFATLYGLQASSKIIKLEVSYSYSYRGSYDNNMHVGSGKYYEYVQVTGAPNPTKVSISPTDATVNIGETIAVQVNLSPAGAAPNYSYGMVSGISTYGAFDMKDEGTTIYLTAKKKGTLYMLVQLDNQEVATGCYKVVDGTASGTEPTSISFASDEVTIKEGDSQQLRYSMEPLGASSQLTWTSSNEAVVSVNKNGTITGVGSGVALVNVSTANGLTASVKVTVAGAATSIALPETATVLLGYARQLTATLSPSGSIDTISWKSSDTSVVTVSSSGYLTGISEGEATITCTTSGGISEECHVSVKRPDEGFDHYNLEARIAALQKLASTLLNNLK